MDGTVKEKAKRVLDLVKLQEKTIGDLRDQNNKLQMVVSVLENSSAVLNRRLERMESVSKRIDRERERKEKRMKRFRITNGRFVAIKSE